MTTDLNERVAALETALEYANAEIKALRENVTVLNRFQVTVMAAIAVIGVAATYFGDAIRKKLGF
ncbi:hypothetical protein [Caulobacter phage KcrB]|nr:hypothetical protein RW_GP077c [Caulobacter phage RW]WCA46381.1 hypothetical protein [Caulobacter phage KcrB]WCD56316.1 hypothetical protein [Caulobacter phage RLK]WNV48108.1 hypothetical protein GB2A_gp076c [Caulobacter phage GB2A]